MRALRTVFLVFACSTACFSDNSVQKSVSYVGRVLTAIFAVLFIVAEFMELAA